MKITIDTSALLAVILNEPEKATILNMTKGVQLLSPESVHWEIGNAFSAMIKRERILLQLAQQGIQEYQNIPIKFINIDIVSTLELVEKFKMYAYDAYLIKCSMQTDTALLTLDKGLQNIAKSVGTKVLEIK
ncbi:MAG: type II toxin-antitoxin system VapC family toxin [gamma proteobacterium symbiont of Taylorina sp.]|nr:type II toxin-antitoxin system VapC family toxin [gamma proteobacterium symbiont of Taylorina sp.]